MDDTTAAALLYAEKARVLDLLRDATVVGEEEREGASELGDRDDPATSLTSEEQDNAVTEQLQERLAAIERAEQRILDGTYGRSVRSGAIIPDDRLEADPAADLTADEALEG
jgi:DnaK suppressor protein